MKKTIKFDFLLYLLNRFLPLPEVEEVPGRLILMGIKKAGIPDTGFGDRQWKRSIKAFITWKTSLEN